MKISALKTILRVELHGREQLWALKAKVDVPKKSITNMEWKDVFRDWRRWEVRLPGAAMPGRLLAGSYLTEDGWDFLYITRPHGIRKPFAYGVLLVETDQQKYKRVIVTCSQKEAAELIKWWQKG